MFATIPSITFSNKLRYGTKEKRYRLDIQATTTSTYLELLAAVIFRNAGPHSTVLPCLLRFEFLLRAVRPALNQCLEVLIRPNQTQ